VIKRVKLTALYGGEKAYDFSVPKDWLEKTLKQECNMPLDAFDKKSSDVIKHIAELARYHDVFRYEGGSVKEIELMSQRDILRRWPRLVAHLICESLGYFTPKSAANAILHFKKNEPFYCEWYCHMAQFRNKQRDMYDKESLREVTQDVLKWAIERRHRHKGYMADYKQARAVITAELKGKGPEFASWF
jgi:hypothetical protein